MILTDMKEIYEEASKGKTPTEVSQLTGIDRTQVYRVVKARCLTKNTIELYDRLGYDIEVVYRRKNVTK